MDKWVGKLAVVTGASAGIGAAIVCDLAKNGINVIGLARRCEKIEQIASELGETPGKIHAHKCDVSDVQSIKETFKWIADTFGSVQILVNNAGIGKRKTILSPEVTEDNDFDQVIATNFTGLVHVSRYAFPLMLKNDEHGLIVNINSIAGHGVPFPATGEAVANVYHGTKHAVTATTEILRQELICMNNSKIRISSVSPGVVETDFFHTGKYIPDEIKMSSVAAALNTEDISNAVLYLLSTPYHVNVSEMTVRPVGERF